MRFGEVGHDIPAAFVGDRDPRKARAEFGRLGDNPDAGFRPEPAGDNPADIITVDFDSRGGVLLSDGFGRNSGTEHCDGEYSAPTDSSLAAHFNISLSR